MGVACGGVKCAETGECILVGVAGFGNQGGCEELVRSRLHTSIKWLGIAVGSGSVLGAWLLKT